MAIPDEMRKCVVFVGCELQNHKKHIGGSAFWIIRVIENIPLAYLVTARHVIAKIIDRNRETVLLRVNFNDGLNGWVETKTSDWKFHQDPAVDVAVLQRELPRDFDHKGWLTSWFYKSPDRVKFVKEHDLGIGDDVFVVGLFTRRAGKAKNIPIVRMGHIAAMPDESEPVTTKQGPMAAYLVESHSIGGLSGSPVFADLQGGPLRRYEMISGPSFFLIGVMHGHWEYDELDADLAPEIQEEEKLNSGIAAVVPCERIIETIELHFGESEREAIEQHKRTTVTKADVYTNTSVATFTKN